MSKVAQLVFDIQDEIEKGELSFSQIAQKFEVPLSWVDNIASEMINEVGGYEEDYVGEED